MPMPSRVGGNVVSDGIGWPRPGRGLLGFGRYPNSFVTNSVTLGVTLASFLTKKGSGRLA